MISIIIATFRETGTVKEALDALMNQELPECEIFVVSPDLETREVISDYLKKDKRIKHLQDEGNGKPAALNLAFEKARGEIIVLTDGDVYCAKGAVKEILAPFEDEKVGLVSGHPLSLNEKNIMLGFWSHVLTDIAHRLRLEKEFIVGSGYFMAIRKGIVESVPKDALSEDALISHLIYEKGYKTQYAPEAKVFVKYPSDFKDWIRQKRRSAGGYVQLKKYIQGKESMRSFSKESLGFHMLFKYCSSLKKCFWIIILMLARIYLWILIFFDLKIKKKSFSQMWVRVESTK